MASYRSGLNPQQRCDGPSTSSGPQPSLFSSPSSSPSAVSPSPALVSPRNGSATSAILNQQGVSQNHENPISHFQINNNMLPGRSGATTTPNPRQFGQSSATGPSSSSIAVPSSSSTALSIPLSSLSSSSSASSMKRDIPDTCYKVRPLNSQCEKDGSVRFNIQRYPGEALAAMNEFRQHGHMCDITLEVGGQQIKAHKLVLSACSRYFRGMFTNGMIESDSNFVQIQEPNITAAVMRTLIDFAYTQVIRVTPDNVQGLLFASTFLEMIHVIETCSTFLKKQMDPSNCIGIGFYAKEMGCMDLLKSSCKYIEEHFCDVIQHEEILTLDTKDFVDLLRKDHLNIRCETEVFNAVIRWVEFDPERRKPYLELLMQNVRLSSLTPAFLVEKLQKCSLIRETPHCQEMLKERVCHLTTKRTCTERPRMCKPLVIYLVGGFCRKTMESMNSFECFNTRTKEWNLLPDLPLPRSLPGVATLKGLLYVLGGRLRKCGQDFDSCSVNVYDPIENRWSNKSPMSVPRNRIGVGVLDNFIYAVGGRSGGDLFKSAERYNPDADEWSTIAEMKSVRMGAGIAVVNRLLYAIGGVDENSQRLQTVECYHPERNKWQEIPPLKHKRSGAGVCAYKDHIYVVGGFDGENQLTSVERYDVKTGLWEEMRPLSQAISGIQLVNNGCRLYMLGGFDGSDFLSLVQSYDPEKDVWQAEANMLCKRSGHGVSVGVSPTHLNIT